MKALSVRKSDSHEGSAHGAVAGSRARDIVSRRKFAIAVLDQLQQDFAALGKARQARPLLNELMGLVKGGAPRSDLSL
jgi:hypothetical protein